jgi:hypothetical protein
MKWLALLLAIAALPAWAQTLPYPVVDTGQERCYDDQGDISCPQPGEAFYGQDANFTGQALRYRDNGDGTVSDLVTGLMWQKAFRKIPWVSAEAEAKASRTGGHEDWRVPSIKELYSLIRFDGSTGRGAPESNVPPADARPYLDTQVFSFEYPSQGRFIDAQYLSKTVYRGLTMGRDRSFFGVNFADGRIKAYPQDGGGGRRSWYARFVRGNQAYGVNGFADQGNGTVLDRATGLIWMQADSGDSAFRKFATGSQRRDGKLDWQEALAFCSKLDWAGQKDWRLPNAKELQSIVDYGRSPEATHSAAIDPIFKVTSIVDESRTRDYPYYWTGTTHLDGRVMGEFAVYVAFGRALGSPSSGGGMGGGPGQMMGGFPPRPGFPPPPGPMGSAFPGGASGGPSGGRGGMGADFIDVHGAGAQRSSPKSGDETRLPVGAGPQGDVLRIYNHVRCVRGGV